MKASVCSGHEELVTQGSAQSWKAKPQPSQRVAFELWEKRNLITSYPVAVMLQGTLHIVERHMKDHYLVIVVTARSSELAARCSRVCPEQGSAMGTMLLLVRSAHSWVSHNLLPSLRLCPAYIGGHTTSGHQGGQGICP